MKLDKRQLEHLLERVLEKMNLPKESIRAKILKKHLLRDSYDLYEFAREMGIEVEENSSNHKTEETPYAPVSRDAGVKRPSQEAEDDAPYSMPPTFKPGECKTPGFRFKELHKEEREKLEIEFDEDPFSFWEHLFAAHFGDETWWETYWKIVPEPEDLEVTAFAGTGKLLPELVPYKKDVCAFLANLHPDDFNGLLVDSGAIPSYNSEEDNWYFLYRLPFDVTKCGSWKDECHIDPQDPCALPSLLLEFEGFDGPDARISFGESNTDRLPETGDHWQLFWGGADINLMLGVDEDLGKLFLLMKAYAIQVIHLGVDTFRKVKTLMPRDFKKILTKIPHKGEIQDFFMEALRRLDGPLAQSFAREFAWNYIQTVGLDAFDDVFDHLEKNYEITTAFLKDQGDLLRFLKKYKSKSLHKALNSLGLAMPPKILRYLNEKENG